MPRTEAQRRWQQANAERVRAYRRKYYDANKSRMMELNKKNREMNPDRARYYGNKHNLKKYGISPEDKERLLIQQGHTCKICSTKDPGFHGWHVDHCHSTGVVRGLLCKRCNMGIGYFGDDPRLLDLARQYLEAEYPGVEEPDDY